MALRMIIPFLSSYLPNPRHRLTAHGFIPQKCLSKHISCFATTPTYSTTVPRRLGNYKPNIWDYDFVQWDLKAMEQLPEYMKTCFLALYNNINEIGYEILKEEGRNGMPCLRNAWTEMCKAYLVEAKWYSSGYTPTLEEFMQTLWISVGSLGIETYVYALLGQNLAPERSDFAEKISDILPLARMMIRFPDDLKASTPTIDFPDEPKRGYVQKSIQCYMHEAGVTEDVARDHIMGLFRETWKQINKSLVESSLRQAFINCVMNLGHVAYCTYKHEDGFSDGFGDPGSQEKRRYKSLFAEPLQVDEAKGISFYVNGGCA
ncbi:Geraniol synthase, chloroplastic [Cinnamomum micranthum f. kanehirae]|uniref:Geraniol synthase, chloroplastic n=1 Tax=Cinnamomum micranthum f. kanehirae TaxID=337451 RepID=A0A3S3R0M0_9MAGN|nr:Geraniol synthase, chloroplastic [Cinnamomum micranthum f. kanehirae]